METLRKAAPGGTAPADAGADLEIINRYSLRALKPEELYCFSLVLCDNDVDRDGERFSAACLEALAPLFLGKAGISDHVWSAEGQVARLYWAEAVTTDRKTALGDPLVQLRGRAYMLRSEENRPLIDAIDAGIRKEISVGVAVRRRVCSVCGKERCGHQAGAVYAEKTCYFTLEDPADAYERSFVAVPAQWGAGVTKGSADLRRAFEVLLGAELDGFGAEAEALARKLAESRATAEERAARAALLEENKPFLRGKGETV